MEKLIKELKKIAIAFPLEKNDIWDMPNNV